jgi:hypothetical protein
MTIKKATDIIFKPELVLGGGGAGRDTGLLFVGMRGQRLCDRLGLSNEPRRKIIKAVQAFTSEVYLDSCRWESFELESRFAGENSQIVTPPLSFEPLEAPSGRKIIDEIDTPPYCHLNGWQMLEHIADKASDSEAQGNRLFGLTNLTVNARPVLNQFSAAITALDNAENSNAALELASLGLRPDKGKRIHFFTSVCGGQGAGLAIFMLACLAKIIEKRREQFEIFLHLFLPGFHGEDKKEQHNKMLRAMSVMRDLQILTAGSSLKLLLPDGVWTLSERHTKELYNHVLVYLPRPAVIETYKSFIIRVAETVADAELSGIAADLRRQRSNANEKTLANLRDKISISLEMKYGNTKQNLEQANPAISLS